MIDSKTGCWQLDLAPKQLDAVRRCGERGRGLKIIYLGGPKWSGKTLAGLSAVVDHAWNVNGARINVVVPSITTGDDSGVWSVLMEQIIPEWIAGNFGLNWWTPRTGRKTLGPRQKGTSKKLYAEIRNKWGGKSHIELNSLKDERDVESEFFNRYFTMVYWGELQNFRERHTFDTLLQCLRLKGHDEDDFVMLCDGNPSDQGEESWQFKLFYTQRLATELEGEERVMQKKLQVIEMYLDDNPYLSAEKKSEIRASYKHDPDLYARYILGQWVKASSNALFISVFKQAIHVIGDTGELDPEMLLPEPNCSELITGWDPGGANPAMVIAEKVFRPIQRLPVGGEKLEAREESVFKFLDELAFVKENFTIAEFTELVMEKIRYWERFMGRELMWTHWSDRSAFNMREPISARYQYEEVFAVSGGKILLQAHDKLQAPGSKAPGIRLWRKLLFQERLYFSAAMTPKLIDANKVLRRDMRRGMPADSVDKGQDERHIWDSARYLISSEEWDLLQGDILSMETARRPEPKLISVRL